MKIRKNIHWNTFCLHLNRFLFFKCLNILTFNVSTSDFITMQCFRCKKIQLLDESFCKSLAPILWLEVHPFFVQSKYVWINFVQEMWIINPVLNGVVKHLHSNNERSVFEFWISFWMWKNVYFIWNDEKMKHILRPWWPCKTYFFRRFSTFFVVLRTSIAWIDRLSGIKKLGTKNTVGRPKRRQKWLRLSIT